MGCISSTDFSGLGDYGANTLAEAGITLDSLDSEGAVKSSATTGAGEGVEVQVLSQTDNLAKVQITGIVDCR
jgi:hypothetical protein